MQHTQQGTTLERVEKENQDLKQLLRIVLNQLYEGNPRREILNLANARIEHLARIRASW